MITRIRRACTAPRLIAASALVLAMTGSAIAGATIGSSQIVDRSIKAVDVKSGTLTGNEIKTDTLKAADIDEATLRGVNAAALDGKLPGDFVDAAKLVRVSHSMNVGDADATLVSNGTISFKMSCTNDAGAGQDTVLIYAATSADGALMYSNVDTPASLDIATPSVDSEIARYTHDATTVGYTYGYDTLGFAASASGTDVINLIEGSSIYMTNVPADGGSDCMFRGLFDLS